MKIKGYKTNTSKALWALAHKVKSDPSVTLLLVDGYPEFFAEGERLLDRDGKVDRMLYGARGCSVLQSDCPLDPWHWVHKVNNNNTKGKNND